MRKFDNYDDCHAASLNVLLVEISGACVDTKPRGTEATCIVSGIGGRPRAKPAFPMRATNKTLAVARKRGDSIVLCARVYELDQ